MACPAILTGDQFLVRVLGAIDCQAQLIGSYGWQALGEPGSLASTAMTGSLTIFVAIWGIRLILGRMPTSGDIVGDVIKIGIVLTLAFSWPAFRTVIYNVVLQGPAEIAAAMTAPILSETGAGFAQRLQDLDAAIVRLTELGSGRNTGQFVEGSQSFQGTALADETALGLARVAFLSGVIGTLALLRIAAGLLLAIAPLAAGLLLFEHTRGLFAGWLRGLVLALLGAIGVTLVLASQLAIVGPWLEDALRLRSLGYATPSAPTELLAMTLAFALVQFAMIALLARVSFTRGWISMPQMPDLSPRQDNGFSREIGTREPALLVENRAQRMADQVETHVRRERLIERAAYRSMERGTGASNETPNPAIASGPERLGSSWKRTSPRVSVSSQRRDGAK
ncbi:MAG: type IV secretion system protein [Erythrobacter sp.]